MFSRISLEDGFEEYHQMGQPVIQAIISALLLGLLVTCGLLPAKYLGIAAVVMLLLLLITVLSS